VACPIHGLHLFYPAEVHPEREGYFRVHQPGKVQPQEQVPHHQQVLLTDLQREKVFDADPGFRDFLLHNSNLPKVTD
jgi:hypothetical protein